MKFGKAKKKKKMKKTPCRRARCLKKCNMYEKENRRKWSNLGNKF